MNRRNPDHDEIRSLTDAICSETASDDELDALLALLHGNKESQEEYLKYCRLHTELQFYFRGQRAHQAVLQAVKAEATTPPATVPVLAFDSAMHGATGYLSGWPIAYLIASVICGIGLAVAAFVHVSQPGQIVLPSLMERGARG